MTSPAHPVKPEDRYFRPRNWGEHQKIRKANAPYHRVKTSILDSQKYLSLTLGQRGLWHGLLALCARYGRPLPESSSFLAGRLGVSSQELGRGMKTLLDCNLIEFCQKTDSLASETENEKALSTETETETETKKVPKKPRAKRASVPDGFDEFWSEYPLKKAKQAAARAYAKATKSAEREKVLAGLRAFVRAEPWRGDLSFCPHAATWLNRGSWEDEYPVNGEGGQAQPPPDLAGDDLLEWWKKHYAERDRNDGDRSTNP